MVKMAPLQSQPGNPGQTANGEDACRICSGIITSGMKAVTCDGCEKLLHKSCSKVPG